MSRDGSETTLGAYVQNWQNAKLPDNIEQVGAHCSIAPLHPENDAAALFSAFTQEPYENIWDYLPWGPFHEFPDFRNWLHALSKREDCRFYTIKKKDINRLCGVLGYMRIYPEHGSIEVGGVILSPILQKTIAATEAQFLMMKWAFENGYRRYEWKCNALNMKSRRAAQRLGFSFEGIFRQAAIHKGRNRDTAWYAIIDKEWPALKEAYEAYFEKTNFTPAGVNIKPLSDFTRLALFTLDPALSSV